MRRTASDLPRLVTVTVAEILCILGSMLGSGVFGGPQVAEAGGGALSADATRLAPGGPAFSIWFVIYVGLAAYTVWQWLPAQRTVEMHRRIGWWVAASMLLNPAWLLVVRQGWLVLSVVVIVALVLVLGVIVARIADHAYRNGTDAVITGGTFGLYAGWVAVAVCANITATLVDAGVEPRATVAEAAAVGVLAAAVLVGVTLAWRTTGNLAIGLAMGWGLSWIAVERAYGEPASEVTAIAAVAAVVVVVSATVLFFLKRTVPA